MPYATAQDSTRLFYDVRGHGEDVLVLLAGQASNHHWWDLVRPDFDRRFRTVAFDYRGTGDSDRPDAVAFEDTQFYGVGAFLLAASAVYDLQRAGGT